MKRIIDEHIKNRLNEYDERYENQSFKFLLIKGMRQIGKTYSIKKALNLNLIDAYPYYKGEKEEINFSFSSLCIDFSIDVSIIELIKNSYSGKDLIKNLKLDYRFKDLNLEFNDNHKLILFFDEIQLDIEGILLSKIRTFIREKNIIFILSGSMLGVTALSHNFTPLGDSLTLIMHELTFKEYLYALGYDDNFLNGISNLIKDGKQVPESTHLELIRIFKDYIYTGGLPEVVKNFIKEGEEKAFEIQKNLLNGFIVDIAKYAPSEVKIKSLKTFSAVATSLSRENTKFIYKDIDKNASKSRYENTIEWLLNGGYIVKASLLKTLDTGLIFDIDDSSFKLYYSSNSILTPQIGNNESKELINSKSIHKGLVYENIFASILNSLNPLDDNKIYYYSKKTGLEIDFVTKIKGKTVAIEVKSSENTKSKSLSTILNNNKDILGIRFSPKQAGRKDNLYSLPYYSVAFLDKII